MTQSINESEDIFVNVKDCFYYSVLKDHNISNQFSCVQDIRYHLCESVEQSINQDLSIQKIFDLERVNPKDWFTNIVKSHTWTSRLEVSLFSYVMKIDVVTVGNYPNEFMVTSHQKNLWNLINVPMYNPDNRKIYVLYHQQYRPLEKMIKGNNFAYLHPVPYPAISIETNSIKSKRKNILWTKEENMEVYRCYCLTELKKLPTKTEMYKLWRQRNPGIRPTLSADALLKRKNNLKSLLTTTEKNIILRESEEEILKETPACIFKEKPDVSNGQKKIICNCIDVSV